MDPIKYIDGVQQGILINIEENPQCKDYDIITELKETIRTLTKYRIDQRATIHIIRQKRKNTPQGCQNVFEDWLRKAVDRDDSYAYAFNYLAQRHNHDVHPSFAIKKKFMSEQEIEKLVLEGSDSESEEENDLVGFDYSIPGREPFSKIVLGNAYDLLSRRKVISGRRDDFIAIFTGDKVNSPITWMLVTKKTNRGNNQALCYLLEIMFDHSYNDVKKAARRLFVDQKGPFFNPETKLSVRTLKDLPTENDLRQILKNS